MKPGEPVAVGHLLDGRYRVNKVIGQGGMGRVYLANDTRLANRPVAVKEMILGAGEHEKKAIEDFAREAQVLASLSHPGIPNIIDYFVENSRHYLVMEFVAGGDLQGMLDKLGPNARVPEPRVLKWARQILDVLIFLHGQKPPIIYRDFKPGNIMIDRHGRAMLIDFGIARFLPPGGRGTQIGSVGYAPPEQYLGKAEPRSDLYSLAATMHHLLTGRDPQLEPPFSFPPIRRLAPEVSERTANVVMRALERDIDKRPASAREMIDALPIPPEEDDTSVAGSASLAHPQISVVPTIVLTNPAQGAAVSVRAPESTRPRIKALAPPPSSISVPAPAPSRVSSTAKTQELKTTDARPAQSLTITGSTPVTVTKVPQPAKPSSPMVASKGANKPRAATLRTLQPPASQANGRVPARIAVSIGARLVAKTEHARFDVTGERAIIGRTASGAASGDPIDIDLSSLRRGAERVSRRHAEIVKLGRDYFIRDLGSLNGTYILGRGRLGRDQLYKLNDHDEVILGGARLEFLKG